MRIAIYGAGSLGTVLGAYLRRAGLDADLITRNAPHVEALQSSGAHITGKVDFTVPVQALLPQQMQGEYDCIILMTKQQENAQTARFLAPYLAQGGVLCTAQNGLPEPLLGSILGEERVLGCTINWGATLVSPGVAELTSEPDAMSMVLGSITDGNTEKIELVKAILEKMCPVDTPENFLGDRWAKLLVNATFSGTGTVLGCTFGQVAGDRRAREVALQVLLECLAVARASQVQMAPVQGIRVAELLEQPTAFKKWVMRRVMPIAMKKHHNIKPSMLQDIEHGKPTEIGDINGVVCGYGQKSNTPTPYNDCIVELVRRIEAKEKAPIYENIEAFAHLQ